MKTAAVLLFLCAAAAAQTAPDPAPAKAPDRRLVTVREFVVKVDAKETVSFKALWVSRDGGRTWKPARETGVVESWGEWVAGVIRCSVRVPEDGFYDFWPPVQSAAAFGSSHSRWATLTG